MLNESAKNSDKQSLVCLVGNDTQIYEKTSNKVNIRDNSVYR